MDDRRQRAGLTADDPTGDLSPVLDPYGAWMRAGMTIGKYELIRPLGRGGMGAVFLARHVQLGQRVAIKSLLVRPSRGPEDSARLLAEARATARARHENIVIVHDIGAHEGWPYLVLEYLEGQTLRQLLEAWGALPPGRAIELIAPVVRALAAAHGEGIVHRDLKPDNIMLTTAGVVKVLDFGVAQLAAPDADGDPAEPGAPAPVPALASRFHGTPAYMSPEQLERSDIDERSDLWAVGVVLYELVTGKHPLSPFELTTVADVCDRDAPMPSVAQARPDLGPLGSIIDRCLLKRRELRPDSAQALLVELEPLVPGARIVDLGEGESPFPGLASFQETDAGWFFGRGPQIAQMVDHVRRRPLLAIAGPSGAGKSSLVRAGVIPSLKRSGEGWDALVLRPGQRPLAALAELLARVAGTGSAPSGPRAKRDTAGPVKGGAGSGGSGGGGSGGAGAAEGEGAGAAAASDDGAERLQLEPGAFGAALRAHAGRRLRRIAVLVDQLEELYTLGAGEAERAAFAACLESAADDPSSPVRVIVTIRADFLDRVLEDGAFATRLFRNIEPLAPIRREGLREALVAPAAAAGYRFESEALIDRMLDELEGTPGALPLLQFAARRLWDRRDRGRRLLTEESHARGGGVAGALAEHADTTVANMSAPDAAVARAIFERLVTPQRTRAVATVGEIRELAVDPEQLERMLAVLTEARLLTVESPPGSNSRSLSTVELVHESLIEGWPTLRRWLHQDEADRAFLAKLRVAARQWEASGCSDDLLWRGQAAHEARRWLEQPESARPLERELGDRERRMLAAIVRRADRTRRRGRLALAGAFALLAGFGATVSALALRAHSEASRADVATGEASAAAARARNASRMAVARQLRGDPTTMLAVLREIEPQVDPPGPPAGWSALARSALDAGVAETVLGHPELAAAVAYSPDGRKIATACADGAVRVWSADGTGEPLVLRGHDGFVVSVAFSPDGTRIASGSKDMTVRVWRADGVGAPVVLRGHQHKVYSVAWSPDGRRVVSGAWDNEARVWSADGTGEPVVLRGHTGWIYAVAFSPDGARIATASFDHTARVWRADGAGEPLVLRGHEEAVFAVVFSPDGRRLVTTSLDRTVRVWSGPGLAEQRVLRAHARPAMAAAFSSDGARIVTADLGDVRVWSSDDLRQLAVLRHLRTEGESGVVAVAFSPDGRRIATAATDHQARVWDLAALARAPALYGHTDAVYAASFSPDGLRIVTASADGTARVWRTDGAAPPVVLPHPKEVLHAAFSPDGTQIVTAARDGARIWDAAGGEARRLAGAEGWITSAVFARDGVHVVTGSQETVVHVVRADGAGAPVVLRGHTDRAGWAAFDPSGEWIVTASADSTARVWRADGTGEPVVLRGHLDALRSAVFSPDGAHVVTASRDRTARVWRADGGGEPVVLRGHPEQVRYAVFSPDGRRVATSSLDELRIWSADGTGEPLVVLGEALLGRFSFSPGGAQVVAGMADGTVRIWADLRAIAPDDPRLWSATSYCLPVARRRDLLGVTEAQARADLEACERRTAAVRAQR